MEVRVSRRRLLRVGDDRRRQKDAGRMPALPGGGVSAFALSGLGQTPGLAEFLRLSHRDPNFPSPDRKS